MPLTEEHLLTLLIESIELREIRLPLVHFFETSFGRTTERQIVLARVMDADGAEGWGECTAGEGPFYSYEWTETAWATDRKSTRLNSSHGYISDAVFCLKKKGARAAAHAAVRPDGARSGLQQGLVSRRSLKRRSVHACGAVGGHRAGAHFFCRRGEAADLYPLPLHAPPPV